MLNCAKLYRKKFEQIDRKTQNLIDMKLMTKVVVKPDKIGHMKLTFFHKIFYQTTETTKSNNFYN